MGKATWKIWVRTGTEKKAREVFARLMKLMRSEGEVIALEPYEEISGYLIRFNVELESTSWNDRIIECFKLGQRVASSWSLMGDVESDPGGSSSQVSDCAIVGIEWEFRKLEIGAFPKD